MFNCRKGQLILTFTLKVQGRHQNLHHTSTDSEDTKWSIVYSQPLGVKGTCGREYPKTHTQNEIVVSEKSFA